MNLESLRKKINKIDEQMVVLLNQRAEISSEIGKVKIQNKQGIYSPAREKEVFERVKKLNKGPMSYEAFKAIYREVMSSSLSLERMRHVAYLGSVGSFTYLAANKKFGSQVDYVACASIYDIFKKVEVGECDYGVVPIENSVEGAVTYTFDLLVDTELKICSQEMLKVSHNMLANVAIDKIKNIYSHPQAFAQCRNWLTQFLPNAEQIWVSSTSEAAKKASKSKNSAAIASTLAAKMYDLKVQKSNIQDLAHNATRFFIISKQDVPPTGKDRTTILFSIKDKVGALHAMLTPFAKEKINLSKIESRPSKRKAWDYFFFVDVEGHREDVRVKRALEQLEGMCKYLKILGSYPIVD